MPGEVDRYKKADMEAMDDFPVALFLEAFPSPPGEIRLDATDDPLHGNQEDVFSTGTTTVICRCTSATMRRVRGCGRRTSTGRRGRNWHASSNAQRWPETGIFVPGDDGT